MSSNCSFFSLEREREREWALVTHCTATDMAAFKYAVTYDGTNDRQGRRRRRGEFPVRISHPHSLALQLRRGERSRPPRSVGASFDYEIQIDCKIRTSPNVNRCWAGEEPRLT